MKRYPPIVANNSTIVFLVKTIIWCVGMIFLFYLGCKHVRHTAQMGIPILLECLWAVLKTLSFFLSERSHKNIIVSQVILLFFFLSLTIKLMPASLNDLVYILIMQLENFMVMTTSVIGFLPSASIRMSHECPYQVRRRGLHDYLLLIELSENIFIV
jgi:hypothetical protein